MNEKKSNKTTRDDLFHLIRKQLGADKDGSREFSNEFLNCRTSENTVLIFEPTVFHAEIMTGYTKYFLELGFNVDLLLSKEALERKFFCNFSSDKIRFFEHQFQSVESLIKLNKTKKYKFVFVGTEFNLGDLSNLPKNIFFVRHDLKIENIPNAELVPDNQVVVLGNFPGRVMVAPMYYKDLELKNKNKITNFISVGSMNKDRRDFDSLVNAIRKLKQTDLKFKVTLIGRIETSFPEDIKSNVDLLGFVDSPEMYKKIEESDFILTLLNPNNEKHLRYITTGITGSAILVYGFVKPCLIQKKFANFYGFNNENSIIYDNGLEKAMIEAINTDKDNYKSKQKNLKILSSEIYNKSLNNLRRLLNV